MSSSRTSVEGMAEADFTENYLKNVRPFVVVLHGVLTASGGRKELSLDLLVATQVIANCLEKLKLLKDPLLLTTARAVAGATARSPNHGAHAGGSWWRALWPRPTPDRCIGTKTNPC